MREPMHDHRLLVCVGPRCDAEGRGTALLARLRGLLEGAASVSCQSRDCLRLCTGEPVVRLEPSGEVLANPDPEELMRLTIGRGGA
jgi:hypothetical protein